MPVQYPSTITVGGRDYGPGPKTGVPRSHRSVALQPPLLPPCCLVTPPSLLPPGPSRAEWKVVQREQVANPAPLGLFAFGETIPQCCSACTPSAPP
jgi:hypothetical protein